MHHRLLTSLWPAAIIMSIGACSAGQFSGDKGKKKDKGDSEKSSGDDQSSDPVMVGGAYLACAFLTGPATNGAADIGCALNDSKTGEKKDLRAYKLNWTVTENSHDVDADATAGSVSDPFHEKFSYNDDSYSKQKLNLEVTNDSGKVYTYHRGFQNIDADIRATSFVVNFLLKYSAIARSPNTTSCDITQISCMILMIVDVSSGVCVNGAINPVGLSTKFQDYSDISSNPAVLDLTTPGQCVLNTAQISPKIANDCLVVPFRTTNSGILYYVFRNSVIPSSNALQKVAPYYCQ